jgi:chlorite dismutase
MDPINDLQSEIQEKSVSQEGTRQTLNKRLFMQLHAYGGCHDQEALVATIQQSRLEGVLYQDVNDPRGIAILSMSEDPATLVSRLRSLLNSDPFLKLLPKPEFTMLGRTYAGGYEQDLEDWLVRRPRRTVCNPDWPWAIWYPLRRTGAFARLAPQEQGAVLREHALIGRAYGEADLGHDIRLACYGLDPKDNDFVIGLVGKDLYPLSHIVQSMRKTRQTAEFIQSMGPFFVGHVLWQYPIPLR